MTLITATTRLSRELRQEHDRAQVAAGRSSWPTAHILPFTAWLSQVWDDWLYNGRAENALRLLRSSEERVIWFGSQIPFSRFKKAIGRLKIRETSQKNLKSLSKCVGRP